MSYSDGKEWEVLNNKNLFQLVGLLGALIGFFISLIIGAKVNPEKVNPEAEELDGYIMESRPSDSPDGENGVD